MGCCCFAPNNRHNSERVSIIPRQIHLEPSSIASSPIVTPGFIQLPFYNEFNQIFNELCKMEKNFWSTKKRYFKKIQIFLGHAIYRSDSFLKDPKKSNLDHLLKTKIPHRILRKNETIISENVIMEENEDDDASSDNLISEPGENNFDDEKSSTIELDLRKAGIFKIQIREMNIKENVLKYLKMEFPFIEIRVRFPSLEKVFISKKLQAESKVIYNEFYEVIFENNDFKKGEFLIKLLYIDGGAQVYMQLCDEFIFSMEELENMNVSEKILFFKDKFGNVLVDLRLRCQLVWNYCVLVNNWMNEFKMKRQIIEKIEEKIKESEKRTRTNSINIDGSNFESKIENSLVSIESSPCQSLYDNQFYVK
jgi:hypothetical protein